MRAVVMAERRSAAGLQELQMGISLFHYIYTSYKAGSLASNITHTHTVTQFLQQWSTRAALTNSYSAADTYGHSSSSWPLTATASVSFFLLFLLRGQHCSNWSAIWEKRAFRFNKTGYSLQVQLHLLMSSQKRAWLIAVFVWHTHLCYAPCLLFAKEASCGRCGLCVDRSTWCLHSLGGRRTRHAILQPSTLAAGCTPLHAWRCPTSPMSRNSCLLLAVQSEKLTKRHSSR